MKTYLKRLFEDDAGNPSSMRLISVVVPLLIIGMWLGSCIVNRRLIGFDWPEVVLIGVFVLAKAFQKGYEKEVD